MTSAQQDSWCEIAEAIRVQIIKRATELGAMNPGEIKTFVEAAQDAYWLELNAKILDKKIELEIAKVFAD